MQVALGIAGGSVALLTGAALLFREERVVGHVLTAVGLAILSLSLFAATSLYELIEPTVALAGVFLAAAVSTVVAIRSRSQVVAGFSLVAVLAAPPLLGAEPDLITVAYMGVALVGIAAISLWQTWPWLPPLAFLLSVTQIGRWVATEHELSLVLPALFAYWAVMTVAAGGEAFRRVRHELSITSAPLLLAAGAAVIGLAFSVLEDESQRAGFLLALGALHGLVTLLFARRRGLLDPFGLLAGAYGVAMATAAVPLLLDAPATSVVWTAEAVTLAIFARRRHHGPALIGSLVVSALASASLSYEAIRLAYDGAFLELGLTTTSVEGVVVGFVFLLCAGLALLVVVPIRSYRLAMAGLVGLVALPLTHLVTDGASSVAAWMIVAVVALGAQRGLTVMPVQRIRWQLGPALRWLRPTRDTSPLAALLLKLDAALAVGLATAGTVIAVVDQRSIPEVPFTDEAGLATLALAAGSVAIGLVVGGAATMRRCLLAAGFAIGVVSVTQFASPWYVLVWAALAVGFAWMSRLDDDPGIGSYRHIALGALAVLAVLALVEVPPSRLTVDAFGIVPHTLLFSEATLAVGSLAVALATVAAIGRSPWPAVLVTSLGALAGVSALYLLSVATVDVFAGQAHGVAYANSTRIDELAKEAQVALSVLWTVTGVTVLVVGLIMRRAEVRFLGLAALAVATVKVFAFDLSSLDIAYRVITLIVLGLLLIASAYAWSRMQPGRPGDEVGEQGHGTPTSTDVHARP